MCETIHNPIRDTFRIKKMALLLVGAASLPELFDAILTGYNLCLKFFNIEDAGKVLVRGVSSHFYARLSQTYAEYPNYSEG